MMIKKLKNKISTMFKTTTLTKALAFILLGISLMCLAGAIISIYVSKPIGDDFGAINVYGPDVWFQNTWSSLLETGRYGQSVLAAIVYGSLGSKVSNILPIITGIWLIILIYLFIKPLLSKILKIIDKHNLIAIASTILITFLIVFINRGPLIGIAPTWLTYQALFWPAGIITYTVPLLALLTAIYLLFIRDNSLRLLVKYIIFAVVLILTSLVNEIQPATIIAISIGMLILSFIKPFKVIFKQRLLYIVAIISPTISLLALILSKGSQNRQLATGLATRGNILPSIFNNFKIGVRTIMFRPTDLFIIAVVCLLAAIVIKYQAKHNKINLKNICSSGILIGIVTIVAAIGSFVCSLTLLAIGYGKNVYILPRTLLIPQILYVLGFVIFGTSLCMLIINKVKPIYTTLTLALVLVLLVCLIPRYTDKIVNQVSSSVSYSNAWTEQEKRIKDQLAINKDATIYLPQSVSGISDGFSLSCVGETWFNKQIAEYYHIKQVCSELDPH